MDVPSLEILNDLLEAEPTSVAEVSLGRFLDLDRWPAGEVSWLTTVGSASARIVVNPAASLVTIDLASPEMKVRLKLTEVASIKASVQHGIRTMTMTFVGDRESVRLRVRPDLNLSWE